MRAKKFEALSTGCAHVCLPGLLQMHPAVLKNHKDALYLLICATLLAGLRHLLSLLQDS